MSSMTTTSPSAWESFTQRVREIVAPPLKSLFEPLDAWLSELPLSAGTVCAIGLYAVVAVGVLCLPKRYVYFGAPDQSSWRDLRLWSILAMSPFVFVYLFF